jgi:hypothetical protein
LNNRYMTVSLIAIILILGFATIAVPNAALAKKSKHNDDTSTTNSGSINDGGFNAGYKAGNAQGRSDAISNSDNQFCGDEHSDTYCAGYNAGYRIGHGLQNLLHNR